MTDIATRPEPTVIDGEIVATGPNPYLLHARAAALVMGIAGLGAGWSVIRDNDAAGLSATVFFLTILLFTALQGRANAWDHGWQGR